MYCEPILFTNIRITIAWCYINNKVGSGELVKFITNIIFNKTLQNINNKSRVLVKNL